MYGLYDSLIGFVGILVFVAILGLVAVGNLYECKVKAEMQNMEYSYGVFQGCMVKQDNKWIDYDRLRFMD